MLQVGFEPPTLQKSVTMYVFNFSIPLLICVFPFYGRKFSMKLKLIMENMWEFFLVFYFVPYKVNIPMHAGEFFYVFFVPYKVNIPMYAGEFQQVLYTTNICWIQVKIHISDQTSLRICNSVLPKGGLYRGE